MSERSGGGWGQDAAALEAEEPEDELEDELEPEGELEPDDEPEDDPAPEDEFDDEELDEPEPELSALFDPEDVSVFAVLDSPLDFFSRESVR